jgi:hypothetical protein
MSYSIQLEKQDVTLWYVNADRRYTLIGRHVDSQSAWRAIQRYQEAARQAAAMFSPAVQKPRVPLASSWDDPPGEYHHRCMHCGAYFDDCQCDGGWG